MRRKLLKILTRFSGLLAFILAYGGVVAFLWGVAEPLTHFNENFLKEKLGYYWWTVFYAIPLPIALVSAILTQLKANHKPFLEEFNRKTERIIERAQLTITGTGKTFEKDEVSTVESQLRLARPVLLTGKAGNGKSGVGIFLARQAKENGQQTLVIDARQLQHIEDEQSLRSFYRSEEPIEQAIAELRMGKKPFRLIIDQLDNTAGRRIAEILVELAVESSKIDGIEIIVISRRQKAYEVKLLDKLLQNGFAEIVCHELDEVRVQKELQELGFVNPPAKLITMCRNLLNLEIVSNIKFHNPALAFDDIEDEVALWDAYLGTLQNREAAESNQAEAERTLMEAMKLSKEVLASNDQEFILENPLTPSQRRLVSWNIVVRDEGMRYRFRHEKLQDYLYARFAAERGFLPQNILQEIGAIRSRNAIVWLNKIYLFKKSSNNIQFLEALLNG